METEKIKAVGLLSGGLDSTLAAQLMLEQGIAVHAINFYSPFCTCTARSAGCAAVVTAVRALGGIPLKRVQLGDEYLEMVRNPKHGYGRGLNPCIDCRIMKLQKAAEYMAEIGASFLFTGEVLGQRPMSQHRQALKIIDRDSGLAGLVLRPLSAQHLEPTLAEQKLWVDRSRLLDIAGRSRKRQIALAAQAGIQDYPCPAGGCLLTDENFADRLRAYFRSVEKPSMKDIPLLKVGRHRLSASGARIIIARNEDEGRKLKSLSREQDHVLIPDFSAPVVVFQGDNLAEAVQYVQAYSHKPVAEQATISHWHLGRVEKLPARQLLPELLTVAVEHE